MPRREATAKGGGPKGWRPIVEFGLPVLLVGAAVWGWVVAFRPRQDAVGITPSPSGPVMTRAVPTQAPTLWGTAEYPTEEPPPRGTPMPTFTATPPGVRTPTAGLDADTGGLKVGQTAVVVDTGSSGLNMRRDASASSQHIRTLPEGTVVELVDGPLRDSQYLWWRVRDDNGNLGWVVGRYLQAQ